MGKKRIQGWASGTPTDSELTGFEQQSFGG